MATNITYDGFPTDTDMQRTLLPEPKEMYVFRNAYQVDNQAPNRDGDTVEYPRLGDDFEGDLVEIGKDEEHPEAKLDYEGLQAVWTEYGFKFRIRDKDRRDSTVNIVVINQQEAAREEMRRLDAIAGLTIENNRNSVEIGDSTVDFNYSAAVDLETELINQGYSANRSAWFMSPSAWGSIVKSQEFTQATDTFAGELRGEGVQQGELLGRPVLRTNTGFMGSNEVYLVDTGVYGWESPREGFDITTWRDEDQRCQFYAMNGEIDWVPTTPDAALKGVGGT